MKITLKRLFIASLSAVCLLAHNQANAMDSANQGREDALDNSTLSSSTFGQSTVFGQSGFGQSGNVDQLNISIVDLVSHFGESKVQEFLSSSLKLSGLSQSSIQRTVTPEEREFTLLQSQNNPLFPPLKYGQMSDLIFYLHSRYSILCHAEVGLVIPEMSFAKSFLPDIKRYLTLNENALESLADPSAMILALKMLTEFETQQYIFHAYPVYGLPTGGFKQPLLLHSAGVDNNQLVVKLDHAYKHWANVLSMGYYGGPMPMDLQARERMQEKLKKDLNRALGSSNRTIDISMDSEMINLTVQNWYNVGRSLAKFELAQIEPLEIVLAGLQKDYTTVEESLRIAGQNNSNLFFSGIFKTTYGIGLVEVETSEKAANVTWLTEKVKKHKEADQEKLQRNAEINRYLPSLRKLVTWFDNVYAGVSKRGLMS